MLNRFYCFLSGRHAFSVWCGDGAIFLRCVHCGRRSPGWAIDKKTEQASPRVKRGSPIVLSAVDAARTTPQRARVLPMRRAAS